MVSGSDTNDADAEYYAFGNPQPTFDPTTHALTNLSVQVVGAANSADDDHQLRLRYREHQPRPTNGFLTHVWWSNYESYSRDRKLLQLQLQLELNWNINGAGTTAAAGPSTSAPATTSSGRLHQRLGLRHRQRHAGGPSFGNPSSAACPSLGPDGRSQVPVRGPELRDVGKPRRTAPRPTATWPSTTRPTAPRRTRSSLPRRATPSSAPSPPQRLPLHGTDPDHAEHHGGERQERRSDDRGQPGHLGARSSSTAQPITWDTNNIPTNFNDCPNNGTAPLPANGVVYVANATASQMVTGANPSTTTWPIR